MPNKKITSLLLCVLTYLSVITSHAASEVNDKAHYPAYGGLMGGYGSTTWGALVPRDQNAAISLSTPISVTEGGFVWGVVAGYEFSPQFALEANYMHYQASRLYFDPMSLFTYDYDSRIELTSRVETSSLMAKFMIIIPQTTLRAYSSAGVLTTHRYDAIKNIWRVGPTFGLGLNYNFTQRWMAEAGINYAAGFGRTELDPTKDFVPFLYSAFIRLVYRF
jgi:opacity protein-like surface antigen